MIQLPDKTDKSCSSAPDSIASRPAATAGRPIGAVVSVEPGVHLKAKLAGVHMSYVLADSGQTSRVLLKITARICRALGPLLALGGLPMARKRLLTLRALTEVQ